MHFVKIGQQAINLDTVAHVESQHGHEWSMVKVHFVGPSTSPLILCAAEAIELADYMEYIAERPIPRV